MTKASFGKASLTAEIAKAAKLGSVQAALPPLLRGAPTIAIIAGATIAKVTGGSNLMEERLLGSREGVITLTGRDRLSGYVIGALGPKALCRTCGFGLPEAECEDVTRSSVVPSMKMSFTLTGTPVRSNSSGRDRGLRPSSVR